MRDRDSRNGACAKRAEAFLARRLEPGRFRPVVANTLAFDLIVGARRYLESHQRFGRIAVTLSR